jgi:hypothetical protein
MTKQTGRFLALGLAILGPALTSCKTIEAGVKAVMPTSTVAGANPGEGSPNANVAACSAERLTVANAVEAYFALEGKVPTSEAVLVPKYLSRESTSIDVDAAGNVVGAPGSGCA